MNVIVVLLGHFLNVKNACVLAGSWLSSKCVDYYNYLQVKIIITNYDW